MVNLYHLSDPLFFVIVFFIAHKLPDAIDNHFIRVLFNGVFSTSRGYTEHLPEATTDQRAMWWWVIASEDSFLWPQVKLQGGNSAPPINRKLDQELLGRPSGQDPDPPQPVSPIGKPLQASYHYPSEDKQNGNHNYRKLTKMITHITALSNSRNYEPCLIGSLKMDGSWGRVLTKHGPLEKGMSNHFSILGLRSHEQYGKAKR